MIEDRAANGESPHPELRQCADALERVDAAGGDDRHARRLAHAAHQGGNVTVVAVRQQVEAVVAASSGPVIAAGSVDSLERVRTLGRLGAWGFTIGGAIFEGRLPGGPSLPAQIDAVLDAIRT